MEAVLVGVVGASCLQLTAVVRVNMRNDLNLLVVRFSWR